ncbi:daptide biosynthesis intramembrane metalloprotease [Microbacterium sp. XT11]|uniref:daptide biosynthesis intramembrane metalloprotease n=1 Tax=Microbacterium sp. XT11 TaxID=367477 RepID=UPI000829D2AF|nr:daptide biosynthesis intramembrane metalloprotease [Microbacterium sp. XT11]
MSASSFARRKSPRRAPLTTDACPLLSPDVVFDETPDAAVWIASVDGVPLSRFSRPVVDLLTAMDGKTTVHELHRRFAPSEPTESFLDLIGRFRDNGLLHGMTKRPPGRLAFRPPFTVQIATLRAPAIFDRLDRLVLPLSGRALWWTVAALLCAGLVAALIQASELRNVLTEPVPVLGMILVLVLPLVTLAHESAHGIALTRFGGRPRRAGFMLFYLTPAFFVDVTDGWRLSAGRQRVAVALAGPAVHAVVAAIACTAALFMPQPAVRGTLLLLAVSCAAVVFVNLIPLVRFDGYIALMSALDEPNLRSRAIGDGANFLTRLLFGGQRAPKSLDAWWSVPFGLASLLAPIVLVSWAVVRTAQVLADGGPILALFVLALEAVVVFVGGTILVRALRRVVRSGVSRLRFFVVVAALAAASVAAGMVISVPVTVSLGFVSDGERVTLVQPSGEAQAAIIDGAPVALTTRGILANEHLAEGTTRVRRPAPTIVPVDALIPLRADGVSLPAMAVARVDVSHGSGSLPPTGQARVDLGTSTLWQALWRLAVVSPLSSFLDEKEKG